MRGRASPWKWPPPRSGPSSGERPEFVANAPLGDVGQSECGLRKLERTLEPFGECHRLPEHFAATFPLAGKSARFPECEQRLQPTHHGDRLPVVECCQRLALVQCSLLVRTDRECTLRRALSADAAPQGQH